MINQLNLHLNIFKATHDNVAKACKYSFDEKRKL